MYTSSLIHESRVAPSAPQWRDGRLVKFLSLALHFRAWNAIGWATLLTLTLAFPLQCYLASRGVIKGFQMDSQVVVAHSFGLGFLGVWDSFWDPHTMQVSMHGMSHLA